MTPTARKALDALAAVVADPTTTVAEGWSPGTSTVILNWERRRPRSVEEAISCLQALADATGEDDLIVPSGDRASVSRPGLIRALGLSTHVETLFLTPEGLTEALRNHALFRGTGLLECMDKAKGKRIALLWDEPMFRVGDVVVCGLSEAAAPVALPDATTRPDPLKRESQSTDTQTADILRRTVVPLAPEALPRPDILLPLTPPSTGEPGPAFRLFAWTAAAHAVATLAREVTADGKVLLGEGRARPMRLDLEEAAPPSLVPLQKTVFWVFENKDSIPERHTVAGRDLSERVGLVTDEKRSMLAAIVERTETLDRAVCHSYQTYVNKKLDDFFENRKALIDQVRALSESFSDKARGLVTGLVRDALAGTILTALVSLRILGTSDQAADVPDAVFEIIAILVFAAGALQIYSARVDLRLTLEEFDGWVKHTNFLLNHRDRATLVDGPKQRRHDLVRNTMIMVGIGYVALALGIANFKDLIAPA